MPDPNENLAHKGSFDEQKRIHAESLKKCLDGLAAMYRSELTIEELRFWFAALMDVSLERVQKVITYWLTVKRSRFFPNVPEFLDALEECEADPVAHERSYCKLFGQYEEAYLEGRVPQSLRSATEDEMRAIAGEVLTRHQRLMLGFEEPKVLLPGNPEFERNAAKIHEQAEHLRREADRLLQQDQIWSKGQA